jgi:hypothetical protein
LVVLIVAVYRHLEPTSAARELLPLLLSGVRSPRALVELADLLVDDPPEIPRWSPRRWAVVPARRLRPAAVVPAAAGRAGPRFGRPPASWIWPTS